MADLGASPFEQNFAQVLGAAPELNGSPSSAFDLVNNSMDTGGLTLQQNAQAYAHASNLLALQDSQDQMVKKTSHHWFDGALRAVYDAGHIVNKATLGGAGFVVGNVAKAAGAGLSEVQHQYRYLHDVEARHGPQAALGEGLGIGVGAAAGGFVAGPGGAKLGGELAAELEGKVWYKDSWKRTGSDANADDHAQANFNRDTGTYSGGSVSIGRDLSRTLGMGTNSPISALGDAVFDWTMDPLQIGLNKIKVASEAERTVSGATKAEQAASFDKISELPGVKRLNTRLADLGPTQISRQFPMYKTLATELGDADTLQKVNDVLKNDYLNGAKNVNHIVPQIGKTQMPLYAIKDAVLSYHGPGQGVFNRLTNELPFTVDQSTLKVSRTRVPLGDPTVGETVSNLMRTVGHNNQAADQIGDLFVNSFDQPGVQATILKDNLHTGFKNMGLEDAEAHRLASHFTDQMTEEAGNQADRAQYAYNRGDQDLSTHQVDTFDKNGDPIQHTVTSPIFDYQRGNLYIPDMNEMLDSVRQASSSKFRKAYGKFDDFLYNNWTSKIFKPGALFSGGFAFRVASGELLPEAAKAGFINTVRSLASVSSAKRLYNLSLDEDAQLSHQAMGIVDRANNVNKLGQAVHTAIHPITGAKDMLANALSDPDKVDMVKTVLAQQGGLLPDAVASGGLARNELNQAEKQSDALYGLAKRGGKQVPGQGFQDIGRTHDNHVTWWQEDMNKIVGEKPAQIAAKIFHDANPQTEEAYEVAREQATQAVKGHLETRSPRFNAGNMRTVSTAADGSQFYDPSKLGDLAKTYVDGLAGLTFAHESEGTVAHMNLLDSIANGQSISSDMVKSIPVNLRPRTVIGREMMGNTDGSLSRVVNAGYQHAIEPTINVISREPIYVNHLYDNYKPYLPLIKNGEMDEAEALAAAKVKTVNEMLPWVHNPAEKTQVGLLMRNWQPFLDAKIQAYKRYGRLLFTDPGAFRRLEQAQQALVNMAHVEHDAQGQSHLTIPILGKAGEQIANGLNLVGIPMNGGAPVTIGGQLKSLNSVIPSANGTIGPEWGPIASVAGNLMERWAPSTSPIVHGVLGDQSAGGSLWETLVPNATALRLVQAMGEVGTGYHNAVFQRMQALQYADDSNPAVKAWRDKYQAFSAGLGQDPGEYPGHVPPANLAISAPIRQKYIDQVKNQARVQLIWKAAIGAVSPVSPVSVVGNQGYRDELSQLLKDNGGNFSTASDEFLKKHPDATAYTVFGSSQTTGEDIQATNSAMKWLNDNKELMSKFPDAAAWLIPQPAHKDPFSAAIYNEQLAQHYRIHKSPEQIFNDLYTASTNAQYWNVDEKAHARKIDALKQTGDSYGIQQENANWSQYTQSLGKMNPIWYDQLISPDRANQRQRAIDQLNTMFAQNKVPDSPQAKDVRSLLDDYEHYKFQRLGNQSENFDSEEMSAEDKKWTDYLDHLKTIKPNMAPIIDKVFKIGGIT